MVKHLLRAVVPIFVFLFFSSSGYSQGKMAQPRIEIPENVWDFGCIPEDEIVTHTFIIRNAGNDSLFINKLRCSCCCSHAPLSKPRLGPREEAEIEISFNSRRFEGEVQKTIYVSSNDTIAGFPSLFINAKVGIQNESVKLFPDKVWFKKGEENKTIWAKNISDSFIQLSVVEAPQPPVDFKIDDMNLNPFDSTKIGIHIKESRSLRPLKTSLTLDFSGAKTVRYTIPIRTVDDK